MRRYAIAFIAGFLATLIFHQGLLGLMSLASLTVHKPFSLTATSPLGVPQVISLAFWGGLWGIVLSLVLPKRGGSARYYGFALAFGAIVPSLVAWFVVMPLKGMPVAGGWDPAVIVGSLILNGAWGVGTALLIALTDRHRGLGAG